MKIIGQNHQFLGVNNAIASMLAIRERSAGLRPAEGGARLPTSRLAGTLAPPTSADVLRLTEPRSTANPNGIGVFWQTQGSGKSFSMVFFAQKVLRKVASNWTFVVVTDRVELDDQIAKTFKATGAVSEAEGDQCHATSGAHLRDLLRGRLRPRHRFRYTSPMSTLELEPAARARRLEMLFQSRLHRFFKGE